MNNIIIVDWGTSNFRATLYDNDFKELNHIETKDGMLKIQKDMFYSYLKKTLKIWFLEYKNLIVLMSGMVGSQNGWLETKYVVCDTSLNDISKDLLKIPNIVEDIYIVPGVITCKNNFIDLMRGEEVQIFGAIKHTNNKNAILILPGTHSKWVEVKNEKIVDFKTNMTGEVFNILSEHSILEKSISSKEFNSNAFEKGLELALKDGGFLNHIFQTRVQANILGKEAMYTFLSALTIATEVKEMSKIYAHKEIILVGSSTLNFLYEKILQSYNFEVKIVKSDIATKTAMQILYTSLKK